MAEEHFRSITVHVQRPEAGRGLHSADRKQAAETGAQRVIKGGREERSWVSRWDPSRRAVQGQGAWFL